MGISNSPGQAHPILEAKQSNRWLGYALAFAAPLLALGIRSALTPVLGGEAPLLVFMATVAMVAFIGGTVPGLLATGFSLSVGLLFFVPPMGSLSVNSEFEAGQAMLFAIGGLVLSYTGGSMHRTRAREQEQTRALLQSQERLRQSESTLRSFYDSAPLFMGVVEVPADDSDIFHVYDNPAAAVFLGVPVGNTNNKLASALGTPPEIIRRWISQYRLCQREGRPVHFEYAHEYKGTVLWLSSVVSFIGHAPDGRTRFSYVTENATQRRAAEEALRKGEERLALTLEGGQLGLWDWDMATDDVHFSGHWASMLGYSLHEIEPHVRGWERLLHPEDKARVWAELTEHLEGRTPYYQCETRLRHKDGSWRWILDRGRVIQRDASGRAQRAVGTHTDITQLKEVEAALEAAKEQAEAASRAKDHFLAILSHELRNPLNPVLLTASEILEDPALDGRSREAWEMVKKNVSLEALLIDDLLDLTRIVRGKMVLNLATIDAHSPLRDALQTIQPKAAEKALRVETSLEASQSLVQADALRLQQVFWNVLTNAVKFTPRGGSIVVHTSNPADGGLLMEVTDSGLGMAPKELADVFEAFSQGEHGRDGGSHRFGGLGLGMSISRLLLEQHGGVISAHSTGRDQGSRFEIRLPLHCAPESAPSPATPGLSGPRRFASFPTPKAPGRVGRPIRILVIEDHEPTRTTLAQLLGRRGYEVGAAGTCTEALELAGKERFDMVLSDLGLPDGDGHSLIGQLRHRLGPALPAIALSGYGTLQDVERSRQAGFAAHLTKPVDIAALEAALKEAACY